MAYGVVWVRRGIGVTTWALANWVEIEIVPARHANISQARQGYWCAVDETVTRGGVHPSQGRVKHHDPSLYGLYTNHIV